LRSEFVSSLCIAEKLGFLSAMEEGTQLTEHVTASVDTSGSYKVAVRQEVCRFGRGEFKNITF